RGGVLEEESGSDTLGYTDTLGCTDTLGRPSNFEDSLNDTLIHLLVKDVSLPKDADNVQPITLVSIIRKVFERLLLMRFDLSSWAAVHPLQAGFKAQHSTYTNAAAVHALLESGIRQGCPPLLSDGGAGPTFIHSQGVLQGSPLLPHLFNIFVDGLLQELEAAGAAQVSVATRLLVAMSIVPTLFYANDGTLLAPSLPDLWSLLDITATWCCSNGMELNIKKCSYLTSNPTPSLISPTVSSSLLPRVDEYTYLSFPITSKGIDFRKHLTSRIEKAVACTSFLSVFSDSWAAYAETDSAFYDSTITKSFSALVSWIAGSKANLGLTANLLGLEPLESRFRALKAMFQLNLRSLPDKSPLKRMRALCWKPNSFYYCLTEDSLFCTFSVTLPIETVGMDLEEIHPRRDVTTTVPPTRTLLRSYLSKKREERSAIDSQRWQLARVIPRHLVDFRQPSYIIGEVSLLQIILVSALKSLLINSAKDMRSTLLEYRLDLSLKERALKYRVESKLPLKDTPLLFTDIDFLLNRGEFARAYAILQGVLRDLAIRRAATKATRASRVGRD
ncbi:hypothetical protein Q7P35_010465, partial [Cladosporium inversicolor]